MQPQQGTAYGLLKRKALRNIPIQTPPRPQQGPPPRPTRVPFNDRTASSLYMGITSESLAG